MVRLKDIAEVCGVSVATVSRALNGLTSESKERTAFICQTARDMGYYPNAAARTLKTSRSSNLGILYEDQMNHEYFSSLIDELRQEADRKGYDLTFLEGRPFSEAEFRKGERVCVVSDKVWEKVGGEGSTLILNNLPFHVGGIVKSVSAFMSLATAYVYRHRQFWLVLEDYAERTIVGADEKLLLVLGNYDFHIASRLAIDTYNMYGASGEVVNYASEYKCGLLPVEMLDVVRDVNENSIGTG